jgi:hypothetical protein
MTMTIVPITAVIVLTISPLGIALSNSSIAGEHSFKSVLFLKRGRLQSKAVNDLTILSFLIIVLRTVNENASNVIRLVID